MTTGPEEIGLTFARAFAAGLERAGVQLEAAIAAPEGMTEGARMAWVEFGGRAQAAANAAGAVGAVRELVGWVRHYRIRQLVALEVRELGVVAVRSGPVAIRVGQAAAGGPVQVSVVGMP
jgi:hypothetical protein